MFFQPCRLSHRCKRLLVNRCVSRTGCLGDLVVLNDYKTVQSNASVVTSQLLIDGVLLDMPILMLPVLLLVVLLWIATLTPGLRHCLEHGT